jgi:hypothetical protein
MNEHFRVQFYDGRPDQECDSEADAHRILGMSKGAIWWNPDPPVGVGTCRRDTNDTPEERDRRDAAWRQAFLQRV